MEKEGGKRKKKTRKRLYFKDLLDAPKKGGKRKKKTRKRLYFKDLLGDNVQSGGLIPRRIYFNDLL